MSDFYKRFLLEDVPRVTPGSPKQIFLGAFGKHPGWDDHVEDLGLETYSLIEAKKLFYVQGIGGEIDAGAWEKLDDSQRLPAFKHVFLWQRPGQFLIGRLWSSSDGKGRTRYPMVICAHCIGVSLSWALEHVLPKLEEIEQACITTQSAEDVRSMLGRYRSDLRSLVAGLSSDASTATFDTSFITRFAARPELGPKHEGWMRLLYALHSQFGAFARGKFSHKSVSSTTRPQQIRLPRASDKLSVAVHQWSNFFYTQVDPLAPLLVTVPLEELWVDVTVGEPASQELFSLRASPKAMPLATEVPYTISDEFRSRVSGLLSSLDAGRPPASIFSGETTLPSAATTAEAAPRPKLLKWLGLGAVVIAALISGAFVMVASRGDTGKPSKASGGATTADVVAVARPPADTATQTIAQVTNDPAAAVRRAEEEARLAQEKQITEEKQKAAATAKLKAIADEQDKVLQAVASEKQRLALQNAAKEKEASEAAARLEASARKAAAATQAASAPAVAGLRYTNSLGMVFVQMSAGYWVGRYEVTQAEFQMVTGTNPSVRLNTNRPVESVTFEEAEEFCRRLTAREESAGALPKGLIYSLPNEDQWMEFVGDADLQGAVTSFQRNPSRKSPEAVGSTGRPNQFGLFDVRGNVWEWCKGSNGLKVLRGGGYESFITNGIAPTLAVSFRWPLGAERRRAEAGFRCVLIKKP